MFTITLGWSVCALDKVNEWIKEGICSKISLRKKKSNTSVKIAAYSVLARVFLSLHFVALFVRVCVCVKKRIKRQEKYTIVFHPHDTNFRGENLLVKGFLFCIVRYILFPLTFLERDAL